MQKYSLYQIFSMLFSHFIAVHDNTQPIFVLPKFRLQRFMQRYNAFPTHSERAVFFRELLGVSSSSRIHYGFYFKIEKSLFFCKDYSKEKQKFRFDVSKAYVFQRKTYAFTVQNLRFWNAKQQVSQSFDNKTVIQYIHLRKIFTPLVLRFVAPFHR